MGLNEKATLIVLGLEMEFDMLPPEISVERPFVTIVQVKMGRIHIPLFMGRIYKPTY